MGQSIKTVNIENVKSIGGASIAIQKPVVLISGDHRSGKSAISQAIQFAIFGASDDFGKRGAGALVSNGSSHSSVEVLTDEVRFSSSVSVNAKGTVSQKRDASPINSPGSVLNDEALANLVGLVPVTIQQLLSLTGEELWQLAMPDSSSSVVPEYIVSSVADVAAKAGKLEFKSLESLKVTSEAISADPTEFITKLTDLKKEVQAKVKTLQELAKAASSMKPYTGRPVADMKQDLEAISATINQLTMALSNRKRNSELADLKNKEVAKVAAAKTAEEQRLHSCRVLMDTIERIQQEASSFKERCTDNYIVPRDGDELCISVDSIFQPRLAEIVLAHTESFPESSFTKLMESMVKELGDIVSEMTYRPGEDPLLDAMIEVVVASSHALKPHGLCLNASVLLNEAEFEKWTKKATALKSQVEAELVQVAALVESQKLKLKELTKQRDEARHMAGFVIDNGRLEVLGGEKKLLDEQIDEANKITSAMSASVASRAAIGEIQALVPQVDIAIGQIQDHRREILEGGLGIVEKYANEIMESCGLPKLVLTPGTGKRPTLLISNTAGVQMSVMCGLEKLIAGAAVIRALQRVRNVVLPLLFLEGGEVNTFMTMTVLNALADFSASMGGNVFMCHWVGLEDFEMEKVQVIYA